LKKLEDICAVNKNFNQSGWIDKVYSTYDKDLFRKDLIDEEIAQEIDLIIKY